VLHVEIVDDVAEKQKRRFSIKMKIENIIFTINTSREMICVSFSDSSSSSSSLLDVGSAKYLKK